MNETIKNLIERRSVRKYKPTQIKDSELELILKAGTYAPSGKGMQSAKIIVLQNKTYIDKLTKLNAKVMNKENIDPFYGSPTIIIVLADKRIKTYIEDGVLVLGNILNASYSLGVSSCYIHRAKEEFETPEGKELLKEWNIPSYYEGIGHAILGYADQPIIEPPERKEDYITIIK